MTASDKFSGAEGPVLTRPVMGTGLAVHEDGDDRPRGRRMRFGIDRSVRIERQRKGLIDGCRLGEKRDKTTGMPLVFFTRGYDHAQWPKPLREALPAHLIYESDFGCWCSWGKLSEIRELDKHLFVLRGGAGRILSGAHQGGHRSGNTSGDAIGFPHRP